MCTQILGIPLCSLLRIISNFNPCSFTLHGEDGNDQLTNRNVMQAVEHSMSLQLAVSFVIVALHLQC